MRLIAIAPACALLLLGCSTNNSNSTTSHPQDVNGPTDASLADAADMISLTPPPAGCRADCDVDGGNCPVTLPLDSSLQDLADTWGASATCGISVRFAVAGTCGGGLDFVYYGTGHNEEVRFFQDQQFVNFGTQSDVRDMLCKGRQYWPKVVPCPHPVVTQVLCGDALVVGDVPSLPWTND